MFTVRCPFCKVELEAPDEMRGQVAQCASCGREIDLEPADAPLPVVADDGGRTVRAIRAATLAVRSDTMPPITWGWAFDFVIKLTVAALVIDGIVAAGIWLLFGLGRMLGNR